MDNHGFASAVGLREISVGPGNSLRPTYVSDKSNPEYKPEVIDLLKQTLRADCLYQLLAFITNLNEAPFS